MLGFSTFPMRDQLADFPASDKQSSENASYNCVPTSIAACIQKLTGKVVPADDLKDAVYGQGHVGGGSALTYGPYVAKHYGVKLSMEALPDASQAIINRIRFWLARGVPCIITMHSHWSTPWPQDGGDGLHVGVAYAISETDAGVLRIMNPWRGFDHVQPVAWWRARLGRGVWPVSLAGGSSVAIPQDWKDDGATLTAPNGVAVVSGFRAYVLGFDGGWETDNWPLAAEYGTPSVEPGNPAIGPGSRQDFRYRSLGYTQDRGAYRIWLGVDYAALVAQVTDLQAKLAAAQKPAIPDRYVKAIAAIEALRAATQAA